MGRAAPTALSILVALAVPFVLVLNGVRVIADDWYVRFEYGRGGFPSDPYGLSREERTRLALVGLHSILPGYGKGIDLLREARLPDGGPAFDEREVRHMGDVRNLVAALFRAHLVALGAMVALALALGFTRRGRTIVPRALQRGALLTVGLAALVGLLSVTSWAWFSTPFHTLVFEGESWRFAEEDTLRRLYPDRFWSDTAIVLGAAAVGQALVLFVGARLWARRAGQAIRLRARTQMP